MSQGSSKRNKQDIFVQFRMVVKKKRIHDEKSKRLGFGVPDADGYRDGHFDENIEGPIF